MAKSRKKDWKRTVKRLFTKTIRRPGFPKAYAVFSLTILLLSTLFWALPSALIHQHNADQLVDPYLFESADVFHDAIFPGQHSFLIKWPLFWLVNLCGSSSTAFVIITLLVTLVTIGLLVAILYKIERRPVVFGTLCLALASVLLLIPAESTPGALLPLNLAMLATRNLEYIVYIASLIPLVRAPKFLSWQTALAVVVLGLLIASDKLFLAISVGGAIAASATYFVFKHQPLLQLGLRWLGVSVLASAGAMAIVWLLSASGVTTISSGSGAGPYALVQSFKDLALGCIYATLGLFTNLGANPAYDATIATDIPRQAINRLFSPAGVTYLINSTITIGGFVMIYRLWWSSLRTKFKKTKRSPRLISTSVGLSLMLIWTSLAALGVFVASNHYYAVDGRYLAIIFFTVFIVIATYLRHTRLKRGRLVIAGLIIVCGIGLGAHAAWQTSDRSFTAQSHIQQRDALIVDALTQHPVQTLVGDYWRVVPIKQAMNGSQTVVPLMDCTTPRDILASTTWQRDLSSRSFAYLLPLTSSRTGYPACSIEQVTARYGRPNASQVIAGTADNPEEILLFYTNGISDRTSPKNSSVLPIPLSKIRNTFCPKDTIMNIVAHQDDDILFMNPDLIHTLRKGNCVRSIYLTAGDSGSGPLYWLGREEGSEAAYAQMLGIKDPVWNTRTVRLSKTAYISLSNPKNNPNVSLIFLHLPDGNPDGQGFNVTNYESLAKLANRTITKIHSVDGHSSYTSDQLITALTELVNVYQPDEIRTQATHNLSGRFVDHSDHLAAGIFAKHAHQKYSQQREATPIKFYVGYPIRNQPENVSPDDIAATEKAFFSYAGYDQSTCSSVETCSDMSYIHYLNRQYTTD